MPLVTLEAPSSSHKSTAVMTECHSDWSIASLRKKSSGKKRKAANYSASPSSQEEIEVKLMDANERAPERKVRKVNWSNLEPMDAPAGTNFDLDNIDSLWYRQLDYGPFLRQQLVTPVNKDRVEAFMNEYGSL